MWPSQQLPNMGDKFPDTLLTRELKIVGAKKIGTSTYYTLEVNGETGIYEPLPKEKDEEKITKYSLRSII